MMILMGHMPSQRILCHTGLGQLPVAIIRANDNIISGSKPPGLCSVRPNTAARLLAGRAQPGVTAAVHGRALVT